MVAGELRLIRSQGTIFGGTSLAEDWRPPLAVQHRSGIEGASCANTVASLSATLDELETDLADDGPLNRYGNATDFVVAGLIRVHGWNDHLEESFIVEYETILVDLVDLVESLRTTHARMPDTLPVVILESADRNPSMNAARIGVVAELNHRSDGSAVFIETGDLLDRGLGPSPGGRSWTDTLDFHVNGKAENHLELGWRAGGAIIDNGYLGTGERRP
ncbi:MAG: hypothetical protein AAGE88_24280 [Actinomycetota bacterium]